MTIHPGLTENEVISKTWHFEGWGWGVLTSGIEPQCTDSAPEPSFPQSQRISARSCVRLYLVIHCDGDYGVKELDCHENQYFGDP